MLNGSEAAGAGLPWTREPEGVLQSLGVDARAGLAPAAVAESRLKHGSNRLRRLRRRSALRILADQFASLMMLLLTVAAAVSFLLVDWVDGAAIGVVILLNAAIGFVTEWRAVRSMEALYTLSEVLARVRRDGVVRDIPAAELVVGDIVVLEGGDVVTADARLVQSSKLQVNESALTGESAPVEKQAAAVAGDTPLAERSCMLYKGTALTRGSAEAVVVAVGLGSELGRITALVEATDGGETPLERRLEQLGRRLIYLTLGLTLAVAVTGITLGRDLGLMIQTAIALAVATVPEGLPIVATMALARGLWRMARRNALVNRLSAVETLGATGVILSDKTGTLTENRMELVRLVLPAGTVELADGQLRAGGEPIELAGLPGLPGLRAALETGTLCGNAQVAEDGGAIGDPMEVAITLAANAAGLPIDQLREREPEVREEAFDTETRMMATFHRGAEGRVRVAVKGAPEAVLDACTRYLDGDGERELSRQEAERWKQRNEAMAGDGLRVLAFAAKSVDSVTADPYESLTFLGLAAFLDPPRDDVREAMARCRKAGIRLVMVTGDQAPTGLHVARAVGMIDEAHREALPGSRLQHPDELGDAERAELLQAPVFARVSPEQKLNLITLHQQAGNVVAMTGDGVNDAPALRKADIGVAMGLRGTQVAREAADMVLKDDAFGTIIEAIRYGRVIFDNIRRFVLYLLSCNVSEVLVVALATMANTPLPILPLQILFLNLVTDVFPALALGVGAGGARIMERRPRPAGEPILTRHHWELVGIYGGLITAAVLGAFACALHVMDLPAREAVTVSFLTLAFAQLWHVFNMRDAASGVVRNDVAGNPWVWVALALCVGLLLAAIHVPVLAEVLDLVMPDAAMWSVILGFSLIPLGLGQLWMAARSVARKRG